MIEIKFSDTLSIWKTSFDNSNKDQALKESFKLIENTTNINPERDLYTYIINPKLKKEDHKNFYPISELDRIMKKGIDSTLSLVNKDYDIIQSNIWINRVKKKSPIQPAYVRDFIFHNHVDTNADDGLPAPLYTFISYIQMPDNLQQDEAKLILKDVDNKEYTILPLEGDILIFRGDVDHSVLPAPTANLDRIVLAGSIGVEKIKLI